MYVTFEKKNIIIIKIKFRKKKNKKKLQMAVYLVKNRKQNKVHAYQFVGIYM
jgi:hypothetical protein